MLYFAFQDSGFHSAPGFRPLSAQRRLVLRPGFAGPPHCRAGPHRAVSAAGRRHRLLPGGGPGRVRAPGRAPGGAGPGAGPGETLPTGSPFRSGHRLRAGIGIFRFSPGLRASGLGSSPSGPGIRAGPGAGRRGRAPAPGAPALHIARSGPGTARPGIASAGPGFGRRIGQPLRLTAGRFGPFGPLPLAPLLAIPAAFHSLFRLQLLAPDCFATLLPVCHYDYVLLLAVLIINTPAIDYSGTAIRAWPGRLASSPGHRASGRAWHASYNCCRFNYYYCRWLLLLLIAAGFAICRCQLLATDYCQFYYYN